MHLHLMDLQTVKIALYCSCSLTQTFLFVHVFWIIFRHLFIQKHFIQLSMDLKQDNLNWAPLQVIHYYFGKKFSQLIRKLDKFANYTVFDTVFTVRRWKFQAQLIK